MIGAVLALALPADLPRTRVPFNEGWRFHKSDAPGAALSYEALKPALRGKGAAPDGGPFARPDFDDRAWRKLDLPHDWGVESPFRIDYPGETGKLPWWGVGWYRKRFVSSPADAGRRVVLDLDGAMSYASVWLNGHLVGGRPYGYSSFRVDLTPHLNVGGTNLLAIRLDNPQESSRWYPGGGIYRNVWLVNTGPVRVAHWGVSVTTPHVAPDAATVAFKVDVENAQPEAASVEVVTEIFDGKRRIATTSAVPGQVPAGGSVRLPQQAEIRAPKLWSPETPRLYRAVTTIRRAGRAVDSVETTFGVRTIRFDAQDGFSLNGKRTFLKGVCLHHDLGALGAAFNLRAAERQIEILKSMGCNAIRTSHNPPAPEFLDLCDRMGMFVLDEFTDTWTHAKTANGYARLFEDWHETDLRGMVRRDRNHPSIVMWSTGNEIAEQVEAGGQAISRRLTAIVHEEDPTRPVTTGNDRPNSGFNGYPDTLDVFGYNYKPMLYRRFRETNPSKPLYGSETASTVSSRGEYFFPVTDDKAGGKADYQMSSYDLYAPPWAMPPDVEFRGQDENPSVFGEFVWTGFDYLGEPTPYNGDTTILLNYSDPVARAEAERKLKELGRITMPSRSSYFGIVDLCGFPKDRFYLYQARWRPDLPMAHLLPHWNWPERVGQVTPVHLYTSGDEAELFLNGRSLGRKRRGRLEYRLRWDDVAYAPGVLKAVVYKNGRRWAEDTVRTTCPAAGLSLTPDRRRIRADGKDLAFVTVAVIDARGATVPRSKPEIAFEISGPGEIVATDNGDATDLREFSAKSRRAYNGLALVVVRAKPGTSGTIRLRARGDGLRPSETTLEARR
jgi:beta-galactosidase